MSDMTIGKVPFQKTMWDSMENYFAKQEFVYEQGAILLRQKADGIDKGQDKILAEAKRHWDASKDLGIDTVGWGLMSGADAIAGTIYGAGSIAKFVQGGGRTIGGVAVEAGESVKGGFKEVVARVCLRLADFFKGLMVSNYERAADLTKTKLIVSDPVPAEAREAIKAAIDAGLTDHSWSRAIYLRADGDFKIAGDRGEKFFGHYAMAIGEALLSVGSGVFAVGHAAGSLMDLARCAVEEGKEVCYEFAALGKDVLASVNTLGKKASEGGKDLETRYRMMMGKAAGLIATAMTNAAARTSDVDVKALQAFKAEVQAFQAEVKAAA